MNAPHDLTTLLAAFFRGVLQASWQASLAVGLVLLVRRAFGPRVPARWHYLLWFLVLARLLLPAFALPHSPVSLENIPAVAPSFVRPPPARPVTVAVSDDAPTPRPQRQPLSGLVQPAAPSPTALPGDPSSSGPWWARAAKVWLGGVLLLGGWLTACSVKLHRRLRHESFLVEEPVAKIWRDCCARWLRRSPPRLLAADWLNSPALLGWWRPTLLLPRRTLASFSAEDWEHVFAHEIAHLRWRDHWSQAFVLVAWCVHWFNPVVWLGFRRMRADRELAADEWVLRRLEGDRALAYGETLYKTLANRPAPFAFQPGLVGISEDGAQMKQRLRRIAAFLPQRHLMGSLAGCAVLLLLGTVVLGQSTPHSAKPLGNAGEPSSATPATSAASSPDAAMQQLVDRILAAARAGDRRKVTELLHPTGPHALHLGESNADRVLDDLLGRREITAFTVLLDAFHQSNFAKDWQVSDALLAGLVKDGRTDFLDLLLTVSLDPARLGEQAKFADQPIAGWITRRVAEETRRRADIEALESAANRGDLLAMSRLVNAGADVNGVGKDNNTPLLRAVFGNRLDSAQWLLAHGALVDKPRFPGLDYTPLCVVNSVAMADLLKKSGANINAKLYSRDVSILTYVVSFAPSDVVEWFLRQGLDPKMSGDGEPNLLFGLKDGRTATLLLEAGVNPNQVNKAGFSALSMARSGEVAQALIDHGAKVAGLSKPLIPNLVQFGSAGAIEAVLKAGADQDEFTLQTALADVDRMDIRDYPEKDSMRHALVEHGAKPGPVLPTPAPSILCRARVSTADGTFVDFSTVEIHYTQSFGPDGGGSRLASVTNADANGSVNFIIQKGATSASYAAVKKGYATVYAGPLTPPTKEQIDGIHFVLTKGFSASIVTVDEAGRPIAGARLESYYPGLPMTRLADTRTDASGSSTIEHIGEAPVNVRVLADGFQADEATGLHLDPVHPYRWTLTKAQPLRGKVVAAATGRPISGAVIKLGGVRGPHAESYSDPREAPVLTTTDAQGDFVLGSVRPDSHYYLFVEAPGYGGAYLRGVALSEGSPNVALGPELMIRGKIIHAPPWVVHQGKVRLQYGQSFNVGEASAGVKADVKELEPVDGEASFAVGPFYKVYGEMFDSKKTNSWDWDKKPITIYVDTWGNVNFTLEELPVSGFVFDLAKQSDSRSEPAKTENPVPEVKAAEVPPSPSASPGPLQIKVPVAEPAPTAKVIEVDATVSTEDGTPVGFQAAEIHPSAMFGPSGARGFLVFPSFNSPEGTTHMRIPSDAEKVSFAVTDKGYAAAFAGPFSPPLADKLKGLHFTLIKGFTAKVQVVDERGQPIVGARLQSSYSKPLYLDLGDATTENDGTATLEHLTKVPLDLRVRADGYQTDELDGIQLDPTKPYRWTLKRAQPLAGVVTAAANWQPIVGAKIKLAAVRGPHNETYPDAPTAPLWATSDSQGRFMLTSLRPDSRYFLFVDAPGYGGVLLPKIEAGNRELKVALGPELFVKGRFLHIPTASINTYDHTFNFGYDQFFNIDGAGCAAAQQGRVTPKDGEADFMIGALYDNSVVIIAEGKETRLEAKDLPKSGLTIDLAPQPVGNNGGEPTPFPGTVTTGVGQPPR